MLFFKFDIKSGHILELNARPLNDERLHHVPLIFQTYHDNSMHILIVANGYSDNILVKLFISEIVHTEDSFWL